jgi:sulfatase modifying factor 1
LPEEVQHVVLPAVPLRRSVSLLACLAAWACSRAETPIDPAPIAPEHPQAPAALIAPAPSSTPAPEVKAPEPKSACPGHMVTVEGDYCPEVRAVCLKWRDPPGSAFAHHRCDEFQKPVQCAKKRTPMRFCIDREEYTPKGETKAMVHVSWTDAQRTCADRGARLCTEAEWQFACEGPEMRPYPYGFERDSNACNFDRTHLGKPEEGLFDLRAENSEFTRCVSPFGVHNMVGNVDEWTVREGTQAPARSALHGGWWLPGRNSCRAATYGHVEWYTGPQVGFRCCQDIPESK